MTLRAHEIPCGDSYVTTIRVMPWDDDPRQALGQRFGSCPGTTIRVKPWDDDLGHALGHLFAIRTIFLAMGTRITLSHYREIPFGDDLAGTRDSLRE